MGIKGRCMVANTKKMMKMLKGSGCTPVPPMTVRSFPSRRPTSSPSSTPTSQPSSQPSDIPSGQPSRAPSSHPSATPSRLPSRSPSSTPSYSPSEEPTGVPYCNTLVRHTNGHLYGRLELPRGETWLVARDLVNGLEDCCGARPHLAAITSQDENDLLVRSFAGYENWIGLTNRGQSNRAVFLWDSTNETTGSYDNWCSPQDPVLDPVMGPCPQEPHPMYVSARHDACAYIGIDTVNYLAGAWFARRCDAGYASGAIVEYDCA